MESSDRKTKSVILMLVLSTFPINYGLTQNPHSNASTAPKKETQWRTYRNANYNFTFRYRMQGWLSFEGFDKNGVTLAPTDKGRFHLRPEIGAGGHVGQPSSIDEKRLQTLDEDYQSRLEALKNYGHADDLTVLSKESTKVQGLPAIISTMKYGDSSTGQHWFDKDLLIHTEDDQTSYDIGLHCSPDDRSALEPLFDEIVKTFRILGPRA